MKLGEADINGQKYSFGFWDVDTSTEYLTKLIKLLGEPLAMFIMGAADSKEDGQSLMDLDMNNVKSESTSKNKTIMLHRKRSNRNNTPGSWQIFPN